MMLLCALIWGVGFVAQILGAEHLGPLIFTGLRFGIGAVMLAPFVLRTRFTREELRGGVIAGLVMAVAAVFQQWGMGATTAANGGFITSLYVVIAPLLALSFGQRVRWPVWIGVGLALPGLWLLSIQEDFAFHRGDPLVLVCAFGWAAHILIVDRWTNHVNPVRYAFLQFLITAVLAMTLGAIIERPTSEAVMEAKWALLYAGIFPVGIAFTLQMFAQRTAPATHAAIILSLEAVFAMLAGLLFLHEDLTSRKLIGAGLMLAGLLVAQLRARQKPVIETAM